MPSPRRARLTGGGQMTVFFNNKQRPIYEDPVKQNYYILMIGGLLQMMMSFMNIQKI